ncbi:unnamed protein product [Meloidogyne enterolobii]|uniref:Uncharacterized protein n=1 Tax=Meloidogyne enterolobii TaxID=390850 RepID=A0ACB1AGV0_MELEN
MPKIFASHIKNDFSFSFTSSCTYSDKTIKRSFNELFKFLMCKILPRLVFNSFLYTFSDSVPKI